MHLNLIVFLKYVPRGSYLSCSCELSWIHVNFSLCYHCGLRLWSLSVAKFISYLLILWREIPGTWLILVTQFANSYVIFVLHVLHRAFVLCDTLWLLENSFSLVTNSCIYSRPGASSGILLGAVTLPTVMLSRLIQLSRALARHDSGIEFIGFTLMIHSVQFM